MSEISKFTRSDFKRRNEMASGFWQAGHRPTLFAAFLYFDLSFMVWVLLGPLGVQIAADMGLTPAQKGLMVATPVLSGALLRIVMGLLVDHLKPKLAGAIGQVVVIVALTLAWALGVHSFQQVLVLGVMLGMAGASFAVALPLASRWYPPEHQGTALGIAGAGNSGTGNVLWLAKRAGNGRDTVGTGVRHLYGDGKKQPELSTCEISRRLFCNAER
jgi:nitrate/nitrite transporter NarK